jgi:hypothetical protein
MVLRADYAARWAALAETARAPLAAGWLLGFNLGDELVWNCLAPANLTIAAEAVRATFPRGTAILWYNEATPREAFVLHSVSARCSMPCGERSARSVRG